MHEPTTESLGTWRGTRAALRADVQRYLTMSPENVALGFGMKRRLSAWLRPELQCLTLHRLSHLLHARGLRRLAAGVARLNLVLHRANISPQSEIGPGCRLPHPAGVTFHGRAGPGLTVFSIALCCPASGFAEGPLELGPTLGANVTLGGHATVLGPVRVGEGVVIGYNCAVMRDVPPNRIVLSAANRMRVSPRGGAAG